MHSVFHAYYLECPSRQCCSYICHGSLSADSYQCLVTLCTYLHIMQVLFSTVAKEMKWCMRPFPLLLCLLVPTRLTSKVVLQGDAPNFDLFHDRGPKSITCPLFLGFGCWITEYLLHANIIKYRTNTECYQWFWKYTIFPYYHTILPIAYHILYYQ